jgi:hypothetical protein
MEDLLKTVIEAHGGLRRWNQLETGSAHLDNGGVLWAMKGQPDFAKPVRVSVTLHRQWTSHQPFLRPNQRTSVEPDRVAIETLDGTVLSERHNPRESFRGHVLTTPWDELQLAYFGGYAMWTYLTAPFSFAMPGFEAEEIDGWRENDETWRGLRVRFPKHIATHSSEQMFYFGKDGLLRRHDYTVEISATKGAHYVSDYREFGGIMVPTRRRVYVPGPDNKPQPEPIIISIDLSDVRFK